jgi:o-succinylbenzoate---CoA ligase
MFSVTFLVNTPPDYQQKVMMFIEEWQDARILEFSIKTSGSTGVPKNIALTRAQMNFSAEATCQHFGLNHESTLFCCLSVETIAGLMQVVRAIHSQCALVIAEPSANPFKNISGKKFTFATLTPMQLKNALEYSKSSGIDFLLENTVQKILLGGASIPISLENEIMFHSNTSFYHGYGMTETVAHIAIRKLNKPNEPTFSLLKGVQIKLSKQHTLCINSGHTNNLWLETNDLAELYPNNTFKILGRTDFAINSGGVKLHPQEIEEKLEPIIQKWFPMLPRYFVFGVKDELLGEKLVLVLEQNDPKTDFLKILKENWQGKSYQLPKAVYNLPKFVITLSGKVDRKATAQLISRL